LAALCPPVAPRCETDRHCKQSRSKESQASEVSNNGDGALLTVTDTGMGISEEDQEQLFTRFFRSTAATEQAIQGTGLGLSIVHSIVTQHGGAVSVDSATGRGTRITVLLPHG
jgi:signal transduction histidine kinase